MPIPEMENRWQRAGTSGPDGAEGHSEHEEGRPEASQLLPSAIFVRKPSVEATDTVTRDFDFLARGHNPLPPMAVHTNYDYSPRQSLALSNRSSPTDSRPTSPSRARPTLPFSVTASPIGSVHTSSESLLVPGQERPISFNHERGRLEERLATRAIGVTPCDKITESAISPSTSTVLSPVTAHASYEGSVSPDQSFIALQHQHRPLAHESPSSRSRRNPVHLQHSWSQLGSRELSSTSPRATTPDFAHWNMKSGLYTPTSAKASSAGEETDESRYGGHLHPTHLQTPKETHKLTREFDPISGRKIINNYEIMEKLGSGAHGTVKKGRDLVDSNLVAIKIVRRFPKKRRLGRQEDPESKVKKEIAVLKKARHPHVVSLLEVIDDVEFKKVYLVLEYVELGEIVWRTRTSREIAAFERERIERELQGVSAEEEERHLERFNELLLYKRNASNQQAEVRPRLRIVGKRGLSESHHTRSLEHREASEDGLESVAIPEIGLNTARHAEIHDEPDEIDSFYEVEPKRNGTPVNTGLQHASIDPLETVIYNAPDAFSPQNLEGTMYGPYATDESPSQITDTQATPTMQQKTNDQAWVDEDDEFLYVPSLTMSQALEAFRDTVLGLEYLHYQGIVHRDIKPANLLWTKDYRVKISDFGVSYLGKPIREDEDPEDVEEPDPNGQDEAVELAKTVGTPAFYAPELCDPDLFDISKHPERPQITGQIDVWALGVTLYGMVFGRLPFFDINEFSMYEKIARQEVYIPAKRLKGVEGNTEQPRNSNRRPVDVLEYEEIDDKLRDLLKRLLHKQSSKRITLREVKHHPWVLSGISNHIAWIDDTDPSVQSQGKKIEISNTEIDDAVAPLTIVDRLKSGLRRLGSLARGERGRDARKRSESAAKTSGASPSESFRTAGNDRQGRKPSLRGDEKIFSALQASRDARDPLEHPLSHSSVVSPDVPVTPSYFGPIGPGTPASTSASPTNVRPDNLKRMVSTADSMKTIRAPVNPFTAVRETSPQPAPDTLSILHSTHPLEHSSTSSLGSIFGGAGRRLTQSLRSRERGRGRGHESPSQSSRSSSIDILATGLEDPHASPSIAISSAFAAGRVDQPPVLRGSISSMDDRPPFPQHSSSSHELSSSYQDAQEQNWRRHLSELQEREHDQRHQMETSTTLECPPSPDDEISPRQARHSISNVPLTAVSSSDDQMASCISESFSQRSIPSVVTEASSWETMGEEGTSTWKLANSLLQSRFNDRKATRDRNSVDIHEVHRRSTTDDDEAGYNGDGDNNEEESDGEDDGLMIGSVSEKRR